MRYTWRENGFYDRDGNPMVKPFAGQIVMPSVLSDIPEYRSPIDGKPITSRSHRREDLARNNCVDARDLPTLGGKFKNKRFAAKRGLQLSEEYRD
jgi:hypothetical protein